MPIKTMKLKKCLVLRIQVKILLWKKTVPFIQALMQSIKHYEKLLNYRWEKANRCNHVLVFFGKE